MAKRATGDGFATEDVSGAEVRRKVFEGDIVPDNWDVDAGTEDLKPGEKPSRFAPVTDEFSASPAQDPEAHKAARERDEALRSETQSSGGEEESKSAPKGVTSGSSSSSSGRSGSKSSE